MIKPKLLFVAAISPFPTDSGGGVRTLQTLNYLAKDFEVYFISFKPITFDLSQEDLNFLHQKTVFFTFFSLVDQRRIEDFFSNGQPFWFTPWYDDELRFFVNQLVKKEEIKLAQIDFTQLLYLANCLPNTIKKVFVAHDISTISFWRRALETKMSKKKFLFFAYCVQIWLYEKKFLPRYDLVVAVSLTDEKILCQYFRPLKTICVPNGIDEIKTSSFKSLRGRPLKLGYIGAFSHPPNEAAVRFFITRIAPLLEANHFDYQFFVAGKNSNSLFKEIVASASLKQPEKIINLGFVESASDFYQQLDCLVTPIFSGSGTRLKILEALGSGLFVISTTVGAEGIDLNSSQLKIADKPEGFLLALEQTRLEISQNVKFSNQKKLSSYLWSKIFENYTNTLKKLT